MTARMSDFPGAGRHARLALLDRYVRIPTLSRAVTAEMVDDVRALWQEQGLELRPLLPADGQGTPALYGEVPGPPGAPTVLLYGHYDVQPTGDPALWRWEGVPCAPFEPAYFAGSQPVDPRGLDETDLGNLTMVARGAADNKGQHLANVLGALDAARAGTLAWRVKVILDGEEEHGSPNLPAIVRHHRDRLSADVVICSDGPKQRNRPTLVMGVRGLLGIDLVADNGHPVSVHSGNYGNIVPNPVMPLMRLVSALEERVQRWAEKHDAFRREVETEFARWERDAVWKPYLWPTVNVNHLMTEGASPTLRRTIIPRSVHARVDVRLTPDTPVDAMVELVEQAVADHVASSEGVRVTARTTAQPASYTSPSRPEFAWLMRLLAAQGDGDPVALPILGGTLPTHVFTDILAIPVFLVPSANSDNRQHDVNEHYVLRHFFAQTALYARIASTRPRRPLPAPRSSGRVAPRSLPSGRSRRHRDPS
jgi:acetylornithine deacetylase/succinyl-diaminopimelate desuccinylase-like protein